MDELRELGEDAAVSWWAERFARIAALEDVEARADAILAGWRAASALDPEERRRVTRARMRAAMALPAAARDAVFAARRAAAAREPELAADDTRLTDELAPTIPGAEAFRPMTR
ncbi:MAG TPA: hypothetical protein VF998_08600 [Candidatus Limnocylindria bacterium]